MEHTEVKRLFDAAAMEYDRERRGLIPCFDDFYGMALALAESSIPAPRILDLGAGTGLFSGMVLQKYPAARLTLMDLSAPMLEKARQRFQGNPNVRYIEGDYTAHSFSEHERFDIIISSLSIHHLAHPAKQRLFAAVYGLLEDGGVFVNADQIAGNHPESDAYFRKRWLEAIRQSGLPEEAINASVERRKIDINAKLSDQVRWMEEAGFSAVDCMYKYLDFGVFVGRRFSGE